eukprot:COSAG02_NODE_639_length_19078_cov_9.380262_3_plen_866_part_00
MFLNVLFFKKPDPDCYNRCPDETFAGGQNAVSGCAEQCDDECAGNGLAASILSALISVPMTGTLNFMFAWLRRPFENDLKLKTGEMESKLNESKNGDNEPSEKCCSHAWWASTFAEISSSLRTCAKATFPCMYSKHERIVSSVDMSSRFSNTFVMQQTVGIISDMIERIEDAMSSKAAVVGPRRRAAALQLRVNRVWVDSLLANLPVALNQEDVREVMEVLCPDRRVQTWDVGAVLRLAGRTQLEIDRASNENTMVEVPKTMLKEPLVAFRGMRRAMRTLEEFFYSNPQLLQRPQPGTEKVETDVEVQPVRTDPGEEIRDLLTALNDNKKPLPSEVNWVFSCTTGAPASCVHISVIECQGLSKEHLTGSLHEHVYVKLTIGGETLKSSVVTGVNPTWPTPADGEHVARGETISFLLPPRDYLLEQQRKQRIMLGVKVYCTERFKSDRIIAQTEITLPIDSTLVWPTLCAENFHELTAPPDGRPAGKANLGIYWSFENPTGPSRIHPKAAKNEPSPKVQLAKAQADRDALAAEETEIKALMAQAEENSRNGQLDAMELAIAQAERLGGVMYKKAQAEKALAHWSAVQNAAEKVEAARREHQAVRNAFYDVMGLVKKAQSETSTRKFKSHVVDANIDDADANSTSNKLRALALQHQATVHALSAAKQNLRYTHIHGARRRFATAVSTAAKMSHTHVTVAAPELEPQPEHETEEGEPPDTNEAATLPAAPPDHEWPRLPAVPAAPHSLSVSFASTVAEPAVPSVPTVPTGSDVGFTTASDTEKEDLRLMAAVMAWYHHVSPLPIKARVGWALMVPYIYTTVASVSACVVVAATTTVFSEEKTIEFIGAVASSLAWKCKWVCAGTCCTI